VKFLLGNLYTRALLTSVIVAPILTLINQYDAVIGHGRINWIKITLTFITPFVVSVSSSLLTKRMD
jgi:hypothetical protein